MKPKICLPAYPVSDEDKYQVPNKHLQKRKIYTDILVILILPRYVPRLQQFASQRFTEICAVIFYHLWQIFLT